MAGPSRKEHSIGAEALSPGSKIGEAMANLPLFTQILASKDVRIIAAVQAADDQKVINALPHPIGRIHALLFFASQVALHDARRGNGKDPQETVREAFGIPPEIQDQAREGILKSIKQGDLGWDTFSEVTVTIQGKLRTEKRKEEMRLATERTQRELEEARERQEQRRQEKEFQHAEQLRIQREAQEQKEKLIHDQRRQELLQRMTNHGFKGTLSDFQYAIADVILPDFQGKLKWEEITQTLAGFRNNRSDTAFYDAIRKAARPLEAYHGLREGEVTARQHWQTRHHYNLIIETKESLIEEGRPSDIKDIAAELGWPPGIIPSIVQRIGGSLDWSVSYAQTGQVWEEVTRRLMEQKGIQNWKDFVIDDEFTAEMNAAMQQAHGKHAPQRTTADYQKLWPKVRENTTLGRRRSTNIHEEIKRQVVELYGSTTLSAEEIAELTGVAVGSVRAFASKAGVRRGQFLETTPQS